MTPDSDSGKAQTFEVLGWHEFARPNIYQTNDMLIFSSQFPDTFPKRDQIDKGTPLDQNRLAKMTSASGFLGYHC